MNNNEPLLANLSEIWEQSEARILEMIKGKKLTTLQAAEMLGIKRAELYDLIGNGELVAFRLKKHYRIPEKSVIDFIARKMVSTALE